MIVNIDADGRVRFIYADGLVGLLELGASTVYRASHVEPIPGGGWTADLGPSGGPVLGPYVLRADALAAEVAWLEGRWADRRRT